MRDLVPVAALVQPADLAIQRLVSLDAKVDEAEGEGVLARWEFGRELLRERVGKQLPAGRLDEIAARIGKSRSELQYRVQFAEQYATAEEVSTAVDTLKSWTEIRESLSASGTTATLGSSESEEWYTPAEYIDASRVVLGSIDLDPASCQAANEVVGAARFYSQDDDGLAQPWRGRIFMNPPFGDAGPFFVDRLLAEYAAGNVTAAVLLCAARLETKWFHPLFEHTLCFPDHRVKFWKPGRKPAPPFTPAFAYLGPDEATFAREFSIFGAVVRKVHGRAA